MATPLLVPLIEDGFLGTGIDASVLAHYLKDPAMNGITSLVPGCTHYPLLEEAAASILSGVHWVDAPSIVAEAVAKHWTGEHSEAMHFTSVIARIISCDSLKRPLALMRNGNLYV